MEKEQFEILLEEMKSSFQLAFESLDGVNDRLDRITAWQAGADERFENLETGVEVIKFDLRDTKAKVERLQKSQSRLDAGGA